MTLTPHPITDLITALLLAAALLLGGILLARQLTESPIYRQSQIISSIFSGVDSLGEENPGWSTLLTDDNGRDVLLKFAGALANAYVSFELIPINEAETFAAIYQSLDDSIGIDEFSYHRKNLSITGSAADEAAYEGFISRLEETAHFEQVSGHSYTATDDSVKFEIECIAPE